MLLHVRPGLDNRPELPRRYGRSARPQEQRQVNTPPSGRKSIFERNPPPVGVVAVAARLRRRGKTTTIVRSKCRGTAEFRRRRAISPSFPANRLPGTFPHLSLPHPLAPFSPLADVFVSGELCARCGAGAGAGARDDYYGKPARGIARCNGSTGEHAHSAFGERGEDRASEGGWEGRRERAKLMTWRQVEIGDDKRSSTLFSPA